ncbi:MAG: carbohydrate ABC transporter permease [bacterium]
MFLRRLLYRIFLYTVLLIGTALFLLPLVWLISTSLKPIEQTMSMPPTFIPYRNYAEIDGRNVAVRRAETIEMPSSIIVEEGADKMRIVPQSMIRGNLLIQADADGEETQKPVTIVREIPASREQPWVRVAPETERKPEQGEQMAEWHVVPAGAVTRRISPRWENYPGAIRAMKEFPSYLRNTVFLCIMTVIGTVLSSAVAAYGFARIQWRGRNKVFVLCLVTMMIVGPVTMVPIYCLFKALGWIGTMRPLWVGSFCAGAFNVFLLRQFFLTIPKDLSEAARIDGCSEFRIFWQIILPLCRPALMVVGLFQFMGTWNDFFGPLIYLTDQKQYTLALGLYAFQSQHGGTEWHWLMAASMLVVLPIIILFFFTQKTFIEGISMTGIKG